MGAHTSTIRKAFSVDTENLVYLPRGYDADRRWPLIVALHGMGMTAPEFAGMLGPLRRLPAILFVPEGVYPFEIRAGQQMRIGRAWYLYTGDEDAFVRSMEKSGRHLRTLVKKVSAEHAVDPGRVFLLGHSQGGYFAGYHAIRNARHYRGAVVIGARAKDEVLSRELRRAKDLSLLMLHGRKDRAVPYALARRSYEAVRAAGLDAKMRDYDSGHSLTKEQLADAKKWLKSRM
jgi:phospholipase/carboxylesterase